MIKVIIKREGKSPVELAENINKFWYDFQADVMEAGNACFDYLSEYISNHIKRPGSIGKLLKVISYEPIFEPAKTGFAIGDIVKLDSETDRAWRAINWGSSHMVGKHLPKGFFRPGEEKPSANSFRMGRFYSSGGKKSSYSPIVKKPIPAMYFVEALGFYANMKLTTMLYSYVAKMRTK